MKAMSRCRAAVHAALPGALAWVIYWAIIAPAGAVLRLLGRRPHPQVDADATTYWISRR